jgi:hypothetical protein
MPKDEHDAGSVSSFSLWRLFTLAAAAVVVLAVVIVGIVTIVHRYSSGNHESSGHASGHSARPAASGGAPHGDNAHCDIKGGSTSIPDSKPELRWVKAAGEKLPVSKRYGPGKRPSDGPWTCFGHSPTGAVLAAIVIDGRLATAEHWKSVVRDQVYPSEGRDALLEKHQPDPPGASFRYVGFRVRAYSPARASLALIVRSRGQMFACRATTRWQHGDWRLRVLNDGSTSTDCTKNVPSDIVRF